MVCLPSSFFSFSDLTQRIKFRPYRICPNHFHLTPRTAQEAWPWETTPSECYLWSDQDRTLSVVSAQPGPRPASIGSLVFLCQLSFRNSLLFTFWPWIEIRKKKPFLLFQFPLPFPLPLYKWRASHRREVDVWQMGKLRHEEGDWCDLTLLGCHRTKKVTQISQTRGKPLAAKRVFSQKENTGLLKESLCCYFWEWCLEPTCRPQIFTTPRNTESLLVLFSPPQWLKWLDKIHLAERISSCSWRQQWLRQGWRLGTLVFTREAVSKLNGTGDEAGRPQQWARCAHNLCFCWERIWWGKLLLLQTVVLAQEGPVDPGFQTLHPAF